MRELLTLRLIGGRYQEVEHELSMARRIHERLFPAPILAGPIRVSYQYEPMRQIGGDYLDLATGPDGSVTLAVIDVTGHGVAAALAVHRLHGELKRVMAQQPTPGPAAIARALNEYVLLTFADERVFATAALARIDPTGKATLCIAGHPSPLVAWRTGSVDVIESSAMMLGVFPAADYIAEETVIELAPGDSLIIYTDGATEAADAAGRQLGTTGLRKVVENALARPEFPALDKAIMTAVGAYRLGAAQDDTLVVCATRS
jgi:serine phosphatase RsbU (regulator of sigma subunit)